jgi:hypothetical protein
MFTGQLPSSLQVKECEVALLSAVTLYVGIKNLLTLRIILTLLNLVYSVLVFLLSYLIVVVALYHICIVFI